VCDLFWGVLGFSACVGLLGFWSHFWAPFARALQFSFTVKYTVFLLMFHFQHFWISTLSSKFLLGFICVISRLKLGEPSGHSKHRTCGNGFPLISRSLDHPVVIVPFQGNMIVKHTMISMISEDLLLIFNSSAPMNIY
jgi:hypothetical protein